MARTWTDIARECTSAAFAAKDKYEEAKWMFAALTKAYRDRGQTGREIIDQESMAASDQRRKNAQGDSAFYRDECMMYTGLAQLALDMAAHNASIEDPTPAPVSIFPRQTVHS